MAKQALRKRTSRPTEEAIIAAACSAIARRGVEATRIADIAAEAGTSTGTVHYYFETKDDVLLAALARANEQPYRRLDEALGRETDDVARLATLLELSVPWPGPQRDEWILFLDLWSWMLRRPELVASGRDLESRWRAYFLEVVGSGTAHGSFRPVASTEEVADRLVALVDGLGLKAVVGPALLEPERMRSLLFRFAAEQLGLAVEDLDRAERTG